MRVVQHHNQNVPLCASSTYSVRPLNADDYVAYRALRQRVLAVGDGKYFSDSYVRENGFTTDTHWQDWCTEKWEHCIIGIFSVGILVGIMGIVQYGKVEDLTVEWDDTWLAPEHRKYGVAKLGYDAVFEWTKSHGYKKALVIIREDNIRSIKIRQKQGFIYSHTRLNEIYADGSITNVHCLTMNLKTISVDQTRHYARAARHMEETLRSFQADQHAPSNQQLKSKSALS